ncbi:hypothetical protein [Luteimonas sp. MC1828]|uniref:hypothetical protein n=1 Tax=Luteimonas sp. MC1828 TaxID=2799787 RepID=UPI0018F262F7|nr:hypothetical protein [Luteimonas sp. MC1828]MBJ7575680.1 hypothetical protein [Luteimonas sp. MC1828]
MTDPSTPNIIRLTDYLIAQGAGTDTAVSTAIFAKIHSGAIPAFITVYPASSPAGTSLASVLRHATNIASEPRELSITLHAKAKVEIRKAALGLDADWALLDSLILHVPYIAAGACKTAMKAARGQVGTPVKRKDKSVNGDRAAIILNVIEKLGFDRHAIVGPTKNGRSGQRAEIFRAMPPDSMGEHAANDASAFMRAFGNAWEYMLRNGIICPKKEALAT